MLFYNKNNLPKIIKDSFESIFKKYTYTYFLVFTFNLGENRSRVENKIKYQRLSEMRRGERKVVGEAGEAHQSPGDRGGLCAVNRAQHRLSFQLNTALLLYKL